MSDELSVQPESSASHMPAVTRGGLWLNRVARAFGTTSVPFEIHFPDGAVRRFGQGVPNFCVTLKNRNAVRAITSLDQVKFADAYLAGDIDRRQAGFCCRALMARAAELRSEAETLRKMLAHVDTDAVSRQVLELINELEAQAKELNNGDAG